MRLQLMVGDMVNLISVIYSQALRVLRWEFKAVLLILLTSSFAGGLKAQKESVDILIVYTPAVKSVYVDHDGVVARVQELIVQGNLGFDNSLVDVELNLLDVIGINYTESATDLNDDLYSLRFEDGVMDEVLQLREDWGADLVCLLRDGYAGGNAGLAYILEDTEGFSEMAFSVVTVQAAVSNRTFIHEIGHNLGATHDRIYTPEDGLFSYSHGLQFTGNDGVDYRTIMAIYDSEFPSTRLNYFSNPSVNYRGTSTGVIIGDSNEADNAATLNFSASLVAGYRQSLPTIPEFRNPFPNITMVTGQTQTIYFDVLATPSLSYQWYEGLSGDASFPVSGETALSMITPPLTEDKSFWLRASNPNGSSDSQTVNLKVVSAPGNPNEIDQSNELNQRLKSRSNTAQWQEFVPAFNYLRESQVQLYRVGDPGQVEFCLSDSNGIIIHSMIIDDGDTIEGDQWLTIPVQKFINKGELYTLSMEHLETPGSGEIYYWGSTNGSADVYPLGASSFDTESSFFDFVFRTYGSDVDLSNVAPIANAGRNIETLDTDENGSEVVILDGAASNDSDGTIVSWSWTWSGGSASGETASANFPLGDTVVTLVVSDSDSATSQDSILIQVLGISAETVRDNLGVTLSLDPVTGREIVVIDGTATSYEYVVEYSSDLEHWVEEDRFNGNPMDPIQSILLDIFGEGFVRVRVIE